MMSRVLIAAVIAIYVTAQGRLPTTVMYFVTLLIIGQLPIIAPAAIQLPQHQRAPTHPPPPSLQNSSKQTSHTPPTFSIRITLAGALKSTPSTPLQHTGRTGNKHQFITSSRILIQTGHSGQEVARYILKMLLGCDFGSMLRLRTG